MSDPFSPLWTIGLGTATISATSGIFTGIYSIAKKKPNPDILTGAAASNSALTAFMFFTCRELAITPLLVHYAPGEQYACQRRVLGLSPLEADEAIPSSRTPSPSDLRWSKLIDSGLSGMLTGGTLRGMQSGLKATLPGALTVGAACTALQYGYNEATILRSWYSPNPQKTLSATEKPAAQNPEPTINQISESPWQSLMKLFGLVPISDEEYLEKLTRSREIYLKRIAVLEKQIEEEKLLKTKS